MKINVLFLFLVIFLGFSFFDVSAQSFSDVNSENWYYSVVQSGVEHGYISGYDDGSFSPNKVVSNGEFYKMLVNAFNIKTSDVSGKHWASLYANTLFENGDRKIVTYEGDLDNGIQRKNAIRSLILAASDVRSAISSEYFKDSGFKDMPESNIWNYDGFVLIAKDNGIVTGDLNGLVHPDSMLTRAEAIAIIERALLVEEWIIKEPAVLDGLNVKYIGKTSNSFKESLCSGVSKFPHKLIQHFIDNNGKIIITNENYRKYYNQKIDSALSGVYQSHNNSIILFTDDKEASLFFDIEGAFIHEFGHYLFDEVISQEDKNNIISIFNKGVEPRKLSKYNSNNYCEKNVDEYWAALVSYQLSFKIQTCPEISESLNIVEKYLNEYDCSY